MLEGLEPPNKKGFDPNDYSHKRHFKSGYEFSREKMLDAAHGLIVEAMEDDSVSKDEFVAMLKVVQVIEKVK